MCFHPVPKILIKAKIIAFWQDNNNKYKLLQVILQNKKKILDVPDWGDGGLGLSAHTAATVTWTWISGGQWNFIGQRDAASSSGQKVAQE